MTKHFKLRPLIYSGLTIILTTIFYLLPIVGDDATNRHVKTEQTLTGIFNTDIHMFWTWSSRIFINPLMFISTNIVPKWIFSLVTALLIISIINWLDNKHNNKALIIIILAIALFPFVELSTAGYIATTVTYLWPISFLCLGLTCLKHHQITWQILAGFCFLLALNNEQLCLLTTIYLAYYLILHHNKIKQLMTLLIPWLINFCLFFFTPGNQARKISETKRWLPAFSHYSIIDKLDLGTITTIQHYLFSLSPLIIVTSIILLTINHQKHPIIAWLPITTITLTNLIATVTTIPLRFVATINPTIDKTVIITYLLGIVWLTSSMILIHNRDLNMLLIAGLMSRIALGFSPTIYVSSTRTFIFCDAIIIYILITLIKKHLIDDQNTVILLSLFATINIGLNVSIVNNINAVNIHNIPLIQWTNILHR